MGNVLGRYSFCTLTFFIMLGCSPMKVSLNDNFGLTVETTNANPSIVQLPNCPLNMSTSEACQVATGQIVTDTVGSNVTEWSFSNSSKSIETNIPDGYYSNKKISFKDDNHIAANIRLGTSLFGITGTLQERLPSCVDNTNNASACTSAAGRYVYSTDPNLVAANIKNGVSIFGITGSFSDSFSDKMNSSLFRDIGMSVATLTSENSTSAAYSAFSSGQRAIPDFTKDSDGPSPGSWVGVSRPSWGTRTCGTTGNLSARISSCATEFGSQATWDGQTSSGQAQGSWKLVTRLGATATDGSSGIVYGKEVWLDSRTGLVWSSIVSGTPIRWCAAAGKTETSSISGGQTDPLSSTSNAAYRCSTLNSANESYCYEDASGGGLTLKGATDSKGGLSLSSSGLRVAWRLPTHQDYQLANINGIRAVMPDMGDLNYGLNDWEWSATLSEYSHNVYQFSSSDGTTRLSQRFSVNGAVVRCVGRAYSP